MKSIIPKLVVVISILILFVLQGCRKTDEDPFISFRSRKNRVVGEWKAETGSLNLADQSASSGFTISGNTYTYFERTSSNYYYTSGTASTSFIFEKDGNCSIDLNFGGYPLSDIQGTWNFTAGIGDQEKRTQIVIHITKSNPSAGSVTYSGNDQDITFDLIELRNKKMKLELNDKRTESNGNYTSYAESWTLISKK